MEIGAARCAHQVRAVNLPRVAAAAALVAVLAGPFAAKAADAPPPSGPLTLVGEQTQGDTTVVLVERIPKKPWETPAWAYPEQGLTFFPEGPGEGKDRWAIGAIWQLAPMFSVNYTRGLGAGFTVDARLQSIIIYTQLGVGAEWAFKAGPFSIGVMAHVSGFLGKLGKFGMGTTSFDTLGWGMLLDPGARIGLQVSSDSWLTLQYEAYLSLYQATQLGTMTISPNAPAYSGFGLTAIVEYSPQKKGVIYYGASIYNTAANYPIWFNVEATPSSEPFSTQKIWYFGLLAGYEF